MSGPRADAGQDALASAGKTGEKMRLDKAFRDQQLRFRRGPVDDQACAGGQRAAPQAPVLVPPGMHRRRDHASLLARGYGRFFLLHRLHLIKKSLPAGRDFF